MSMLVVLLLLLVVLAIVAGIGGPRVYTSRRRTPIYDDDAVPRQRHDVDDVV